MKIDTFLFDFDGTVANTIPGIMATLEKTRTAMACDFTLDYAKSLIGIPLVMMGVELCGQNRAAEFVETYRKEYIEWGADLITFYDGMEDILKFLKDEGLTAAVVTSKRRDSLLLNLKHLKAADYFDLLVTKESTSFFKPHPAPVEYALTGLNASPQQSVMIGDTHYDLECGIGAGVTTIGVTWGVETRAQIELVKPDFITDTPKELDEIIQSLLNKR